jgi:lipoprotein-anchoring transpeptidase ErfK/SrfK
MRDQTNKRAALLACSPLAVLLIAWPTAAAATSAEAAFWRDGGATERPIADASRPAATAGSVSTRKRRQKSARPTESEHEPPVPPGPLHIIVSLDKQKATLFANGAPVTQSTISSGTRSHPTPMGVFSIIQKRRHHVSNLYGAKMPYMQRLTWSGTAMHQGPLPGYPASHGCIRLPKEFAELLWKTTKIGARVIITRDEVVPVPIDHPRLFAPAPPMAALPRASMAPSARTEAGLVRTADGGASMPAAVVVDAVKPVVATPAASRTASEQATKLAVADAGVITIMQPIPAAEVRATQNALAAPAQPRDALAAAAIAASPDATVAAAEPNVTVSSPASAVSAPPTIILDAATREKRSKPVSVFISRKDGRLYVRQAMEPLFDMPVTIQEPERPLGTHIYTAMMPKNDALQWTVVSIPSSFPREATAEAGAAGVKARKVRPAKASASDGDPPSNASEALDRIVVPAEAVARIAELIKPGSSLIISDNKLSGETGSATDFIVLTR